MGCFQSRHRGIKKIGKFPGIFSKTATPTLSDEQRKIVSDSWQEIKDNVEKVGVITFMNLFETHPEVQNTFMPFRHLKKMDMEHSAVLRSHSLRVMGTVEKFMSRIDSQEKSRGVIIELGQRHEGYNAKSEFFDMVGPQFIYAIKPQFGDRWNDALEEAWLKLFQIISFYMRKGLKRARNK